MIDINKIKVLDIKTPHQLRKWFKTNVTLAQEVWLPVKIGKPDKNHLSYVDTLEVALCYGWIDSLNLHHPKFGHIHKLSPRIKTSKWSELNKTRCRRLIRLGWMTEFGFKTLPDLQKPLIVEPELMSVFRKNKKLKHIFCSFPILYQTIRLGSIQRYKKINKKQYKISIKNFVKKTLAGKMYGNWNDFGRLTEKDLPKTPIKW